MKTLPPALFGGLLASLALCACHPAQAQGPKTYVVTQAPYNADNTGKTDAAPAIDQAIADAIAYGNTNNVPVTVSLPAGTYYLNSKAISVSNAQSAITLTGHTSGDTFLTYNNQNGGSSQNSRALDIGGNTGSVTVENFTEDVCSASQIAFTQGTITAFNRAANPPTITVKVEAGYPLLNRPDILADPQSGGASDSHPLYTFSDPKRPTWDQNSPLMQSITPSADGTTAVIVVRTGQAPQPIPFNIHVGEPWLIFDSPPGYITGAYNYGQDTNVFDDNNNLTVQNVNYYGGIDAEHATAGRGYTPNSNYSFINYYQGPPPAPAQSTATRPTRFLPDRRITTMEGYQGGSRGTMSFMNCDMSGGWDDVLDLGGQVSTITAQPAQNQIKVSGLSGIYLPSDQIELSLTDATRAVYATTAIAQNGVQTNSDGSITLTLSQNVSVQNAGSDICTDLSANGPITLTNSSFSSQFGRVFLKGGGGGTGITVTGCTFHDFYGFNGLAVLGALGGYGQGPLTAHNVLIQGNVFRNCQYPCVIKNGTAASGSNVRVLNNTFLDTSSDPSSEPNESSTGPALVLNSVSGATVSGNSFDRNWGANVTCENDQNLTISGNTFSHPNFIRPVLVAPYTGQPDPMDPTTIVPDPSSVVYLANDSGVTLSGNLVNSAGAYTQQLVEANGVTGALGLTSGIVQVDSPLAFYLGYDGLVMDQPSTGSILDQATWTGGANQKWLLTPATAVPSYATSTDGYATLTDTANGKLVGVGTPSRGAGIALEAPADAPGTANPAAEQLWDFGIIDNNTSNILNGVILFDTNNGPVGTYYGPSGYAVNVLYQSSAAGVGLCQYDPGSAPNQNFYAVSPPTVVAQSALGQVALNWAPVPFAGSYNVARATPGGTYANVATNLTAATYTDTTVTPGATYDYEVIASGPPVSNNTSAPVAVKVTTTFTGLPVDLAPAFNVAALQPDIWPFLGGGLDGNGFAYSSTLLGLGLGGGNLTWAGDVFTLGPPARPDAVADAGQRIVLPTGNFSKLLVLGAYLGTGPSSTGTFTSTVTYTDGTSATLSQDMTNWCGTAGQPGESNAATLTYRNTATGAPSSLTDYVHGYTLALDPTRTTQWLDLPNTGQFRLLAMDLNVGPSVLAQGASMSAGQYLTSPSGKCFLTMQTDSNLCLYAGSGPSNKGVLLWQSATAGNGGGYVTLQSDGNLVMHAGTLAAPLPGVWDTKTYFVQLPYAVDKPLNAYLLQVTDAGQVQVLFDGNVIWSNGANVTPPAQQPWQATAGTTLTPGQYLESPSGKYCLTMQASGNLVLTQGSSPTATGGQVLASATAENGGVYLIMQADGNLVMYQGTPASPGPYAGWATATYGNSNASLQLTDKGEAQVVSSAGAILWQKP